MSLTLGKLLCRLRCASWGPPPSSPDGQAGFLDRVADALQREWRRLYQRAQHARRFGLIRLALVFVLSLMWGAASAETAPKVPPQSPSQVRLSFAPVVNKV